MNKRVAVIGIIVKNMDSVDKLNIVLHDYSDIIVGRMGLPYKVKNINIISIAVDAKEDIVNTLMDNIKKISDITANIAYSDIEDA